MAVDLNVVRSAFDAFPLASDPAFRSVVSKVRLRHAGVEGAPDLVDEYSARLVCTALQSGASDAILIVFPDELERRTPLLFSTALIMDGLAHIEAGTVGRCVLYLSSYIGIRRQLGSVRLGSITLDSVFTQYYGRGQGDDLRIGSLPGGIHLPSVLWIHGPADPARLLRQHRPKWVAVDGGESHELPWLRVLLLEARKLGLPVVGWTTRPLSGVVDQWLEAGGGVFRWPKLGRTVAPRITSLEQLSKGSIRAEITPRILTGKHVIEISKAFATAAEALLAAGEFQDGRLSKDAVMLGWKYLRAMESIPVPVEVYEREAHSYWGLRPIVELRGNFARFVEAVQPLSPQLHARLQDAADALSRCYEEMVKGESPLWLGLANLCVESSAPRRIVFASRSKREMFSFCLLARFNISEDDLREIGVCLGYVSEREEANTDNLDREEGRQESAQSVSPLLVGLPSRAAEKYIDTLLDSGHLEILLWPHQERVLEYRLCRISSKLGLAATALRRFLPSLDERAACLGAESVADEPALKLARSREVTAGSFDDELRRKTGVVSLWKRPDVSEVITSLFGTVADAEEEEDYWPPTLLEDGAIADELKTPGDKIWVQEAFELHLEGALCVLLPADETVNVIVRVPSGVQLEPRYVRSLRVGDEILFIEGQRRQDLYQLLVSRVHRDPVIAQYLALVRRWQDDFVRAFEALEREGRISPESLLRDLQAKGSSLTSPLTIRTWLRRLVLAPNDAQDLKRIAEVLSLGFVASYYRQIDRAGKRLKGLHINLSRQLNRWLTASAAGSVTVGGADEVIDAELGLTVEDFRHSLLRARILAVNQRQGPFYRPHMGRLERGRP